MTGKTTAPYGEWISPIAAAMLSEAGRQLTMPGAVGEEIWWTEGRPTEAGRMTVLARRADGTIDELLPAPWNARSRVHEYGGRSWLAVPTPDGTAIAFTHAADQRLYLLAPGTHDPVALTPEPDEPLGLRYADLTLTPDGTAILAVRERHRAGAVERHLVSVPLDESGDVRVIVGGSHFLAAPRISPDGERLAWLAWNHPDMPWDGTELRVGRFDYAGRIPAWTTVLGGAAESIFQPEWANDDELYAVSDRTGWWNLYRVPASGGEPAPLHPADEEFGAPLWQLGMATYAVLPDGRLLCVHGTGTQRAGILDPASGELDDLDLPFEVFVPMVSVHGTSATLLVGGPATPASVIRVDTTTSSFEVVRSSIDADRLPDAAYISRPEPTTFRGPDGREIHAFVYPPANPGFEAPDGDKPPYLVHVHGGPTSQVYPILNLPMSFFTSRGIGVLDVNYGGSTGYGRAYRDRLQGQWGIVDVEDSIAAAQALVDRGDADRERLGIYGGSAGGWTTLCAIVGSDAFAAGVSICGVTNVMSFQAITHDFESRYLEGLLAGGPDLEAVAAERSPLARAGRTRCPVLLLQGADDPIVPLVQAVEFRDALADNGIPHALLVFEGEQHGFRKAESISRSYEAMLSFLGQVLGFDPPGVEKLELSS